MVFRRNFVFSKLELIQNEQIENSNDPNYHDSQYEQHHNYDFFTILSYGNEKLIVNRITIVDGIVHEPSVDVSLAMNVVETASSVVVTALIQHIAIFIVSHLHFGRLITHQFN